MITGSVRGLEEVTRNLSEEIKKISKRTQAGITEAALMIREESQKLVPMDFGNLENSAYTVWPTGESSLGSFTDTPERPNRASEMKTRHSNVISGDKQLVMGSKDPVAIIGYSAVYALATHENIRAGKTGGTSLSGAKYPHWATVGEWKFLENAVKNNVSRILDIVRNNAKVKT
ncbi:MAG: hypothetical protein ACTSYH_03545 [Candidatus Heimdallarchaeaceae archaeon]